MLERRSTKRFRNEFDRYIDSPNDLDIPSILRWWKAHSGRYPQLSLMARDVLAVPASGSSVERQFSVSGRMAIWQRNRLSGQTISDAMMYKSFLMNTRSKLETTEMDMDEDLPVSANEGELPNEWRQNWWMTALKMIPGTRDIIDELENNGNGSDVEGSIIPNSMPAESSGVSSSDVDIYG